MVPLEHAAGPAGWAGAITTKDAQMPRPIPRANTLHEEDAVPVARSDIEATPPVLRNPELSPSAQAATGAATARPGGAATGGLAGNYASNGHWSHDDLGPRRHVPPAPDDARVIREIEERFVTLDGVDLDRVVVSVSDGAIILSGSVDTAEQRRKLGARAVDASGGLRVANNLTIRADHSRKPT